MAAFSTSFIGAPASSSFLTTPSSLATFSLPLASLPRLFRTSVFASPFSLLIPSSSYGFERCTKLPLPTHSGFQILTKAAETAVETEQSPATSALKEFLEELKGVGRIRIIVNTGVGVLESITSLEKLFYHTMAGRGEYANLMNKEENVDFHLLLDKVTAAKLVKGKSMRGDIPTYTVRFLDDENKTAALILLMWKPDTNGEYDPGQVEAYETLLEKYGSDLSFRSK